MINEVKEPEQKCYGADDDDVESRIKADIGMPEEEKIPDAGEDSHEFAPGEAEHYEHKIGHWTEEEGHRFEEAFSLFGNNWGSVAEFVGTRTKKQVKSYNQKAAPRRKLSEFNKLMIAQTVVDELPQAGISKSGSSQEEYKEDAIMVPMARDLWNGLTQIHEQMLDKAFVLTKQSVSCLSHELVKQEIINKQAAVAATLPEKLVPKAYRVLSTGPTTASDGDGPRGRLPVQILPFLVPENALEDEQPYGSEVGIQFNDFVEATLHLAENNDDGVNS
ncbi:MAG: SANT/Myb-like DNA-binding domain-containing protein [Candidatus Pacebacteria bacterium]|nr:SANT/Myb-like DNA-binding domain-containing protein [Candidatus Paceibacterota bacterium]